jgi:drug/metabolite transporter (DMT)-like permease
MIFLVLAVLCSTGNQLLFKMFARLRIDLFSAIVANYSVCVVIGFSSSGQAIRPGAMFTQGWHFYSILQGGLFVACLFLLGLTTARHGVAVASLATRLSVVIPTMAAFLLYGDLLTVFKIGGILASLLALYLSSTDRAGNAKAVHSPGILPLSLFIVFGLYATLLKYVQEKFLSGFSYHTYVLLSFLSAFLLSAALLAWRLFKKKQVCRWQDMLAGFVLGCSNYGAVYFLIRTLGVPGWQSSQLFPTVSISVVTLSTLGAWAFFNEKLQRRILWALAIGIGSIVIVNL